MEGISKGLIVQSYSCLLLGIQMAQAIDFEIKKKSEDTLKSLFPLFYFKEPMGKLSGTRLPIILFFLTFPADF